MASAQLALGMMVVEVTSPGIGHIAKAAGCDFIIFDMEHGCFGYETIKALVRYAEAAEICAIVRVPSSDSHDLTRVLDAGADGVMVPMVSSVDEARHIVSTVKYPPIGHRGVAQQIGKDRYRPTPIAESLARANQQTKIWVQIETAEGARNANAIAAVASIDALWLGHVDLSCSLGAPGDFTSAEFSAAVKAIIAGAGHHCRSLGRMVSDAAGAAAAQADGFDLIAVGNDVRALYAGVKSGIDAIRTRTGRTVGIMS